MPRCLICLEDRQAEGCLQLQDKDGWGHTQCCGNTYHFGCLFSW